MGIEWEYDLKIMVPEAKKTAFHAALIQLLTNAKNNGDITSAKGACQPTEVPEEFEIT